MKTALLHLVFDVAAFLFSQVAQHLGEHPFQRVVAHLTTMRAVRILNRLVAVVADVESGAVEMTGVLRRIAVAPTKLRHILLRTKHAGDDNLMQRHALDVEAVEERLADVLQQYGGTRHKIRNAGIKRIDMVIRVGTDVDQLAFARLSILAVSHRRDTPSVGGRQLKAVGIWEGHSVVGHRTDLVIGFTIDGFTICNFGLRHRWGYSRGGGIGSRRCTGDGHLKECPSDARKEQNDGCKS